MEGVLSTRNKECSEVSEREKVYNIFKGIAEDAFSHLVINDCSTVEDTVSENRRFEAAKGSRFTNNCRCLPNTSITSSYGSHIFNQRLTDPTSNDIT